MFRLNYIPGEIARANGQELLEREYSLAMIPTCHMKIANVAPGVGRDFGNCFSTRVTLRRATQHP